jgi:hypothetical protein
MLPHPRMCFCAADPFSHTNACASVPHTPFPTPTHVLLCRTPLFPHQRMCFCAAHPFSHTHACASVPHTPFPTPTHVLLCRTPLFPHPRMCCCAPPPPRKFTAAKRFGLEGCEHTQLPFFHAHTPTHVHSMLHTSSMLHTRIAGTLPSTLAVLSPVHPLTHVLLHTPSPPQVHCCQALWPGGL